MRNLVLRAALFGALAMLTAAPPATAQDYPNRPIRMLVPIPPGGAPDIAARLVANGLSAALGQPVVVENRTGANGNIAADATAKATPDGYTLLLGADSGFVVNPHVYAKLTFDPLKDLIPVASVATNQFTLAVHPSLPVKTLQEFVDYAKKSDPPLAYASGGNGSQHQLAMEMLRQYADIKLLHVPFRGGSPAATATIAGETKATFAGASATGQFQSGHLRPIAASGKHRSKKFPDLPTIGETYPGYSVDIWLGLFAPAGTPEPIVSRLHAEVKKLLNSEEFVSKLRTSGSLEPLDLSPKQFSDLIHEDYEKYGKLVKTIGIKLD